MYCRMKWWMPMEFFTVRWCGMMMWKEGRLMARAMARDPFVQSTVTARRYFFFRALMWNFTQFGAKIETSRKDVCLPVRFPFPHVSLTKMGTLYGGSAATMGKGSSAAIAAALAGSVSVAGEALHNFCSAFQGCEKADPHLPSMIVFDLDDCIWTPEMHELSGKPSVPVEGPLDPLEPTTSDLGTIGMRVRSRRGMWDGNEDECVMLYDGARLALRELALNPIYRGIKLAAASSSLEPTYSHACLRGIEVMPGLTLRDMFSYDQIGRTGKLTPRKTSHFRELHKESGVPYEEMLFFDDCNWGDHCADVTRAYGVVSQRTPSGMRLEEFHRGLDKYRKESESRNRKHVWLLLLK